MSDADVTGHLMACPHHRICPEADLSLSSETGLGVCMGKYFSGGTTRICSVQRVNGEGKGPEELV